MIGHIAAKIAAHKVLIMIGLTMLDGVQTHLYQAKFKGLPPANTVYYSGSLRRISPGRLCDIDPLVGCHPIGFEVAPDAILALVLSRKHVKHADALVWSVAIEEAAFVTWNLTDAEHRTWPKPDGSGPNP